MFHVKTLNKLEIEDNFFNPIKDIYEKPRANIILNAKRLIFCLNSKRQNYMFSPILLKISLQIVFREVRLVKEIKGKQIGREDIKLYFQKMVSYMYIVTPKAQ